MAGKIDNRLARECCNIIHELLSKEELQAVNLINENERMTSDYCGTSEFCDTRVVLHDAFKKTFGYSLENATAEYEELSNDTWDACKHAHFNPEAFIK